MNYLPTKRDVREQMEKKLPYRVVAPGKFAGLDYVLEGESIWGKAVKYEKDPSTEYISALTSLTYDPDLGDRRPSFVQAVLDACSPFQLVSKFLAADLVVDALAQRDVEPNAPDIYHIGSWFGQLAAITNAYGRNHFLIDKDPWCAWVTDRILPMVFRSRTRSYRSRTVDVAEFKHPILGSAAAKEDFVTWTGLEHFDPRTVQEYIKNAPNLVTYIFMATDMPAPDHVYPYTSVSSILEVLADLPMEISRTGALQSAVGNRYYVVAQTNTPF